MVRNSTFVRNRAISYSNIVEGGGGVLFSLECTVIIAESKLDGNTATSKKGGGGALYSSKSTIALKANEFNSNSATSERTDTGGVLHSDHSFVKITASEFNHNTAVKGGVVRSEHCNITIIASRFYDNHATSKGVIRFAVSRGGVLYSESSTVIIQFASEYYGNTTICEGGVIFSHNSSISIETKSFESATEYHELEGVLRSMEDGKKFHR